MLDGPPAPHVSGFYLDIMQSLGRGDSVEVMPVRGVDDDGEPAEGVVALPYTLTPTGVLGAQHPNPRVRAYSALLNHRDARRLVSEKHDYELLT